VGHIVRETMGRIPAHVSRDELTSAGLAALAAAARGFDPDRGVKFASFAAIRVRGAILDELRGLDWASRSVRRRARELDETRQRLASELGRVATDGEVALATGLSAREVSDNSDDVARASILSLNGFSETPIDELIPTRGPSPEQTIEMREQVGYLIDAVAELPERLRAVVEAYFFAERPMAEIADELGVTESRVSQMRAEALVLLKGALDFSLGEAPAKIDQAAGVAARRRQSYFETVSERRTMGQRLGVAS
jgi:RNA polymerase sigma factor for flagellar operon FliA